MAGLFLDVVSDHAPDHEVILLGDFDGGEVAVLWHQEKAVFAFVYVDALEREVPVYEGHDDVPFGGLDGLVNDQEIPVIDAAVLHALSHASGIKCCGRVGDEYPVQVDGLIHVVCCRGRKTGPYTPWRIR